MKHYKTEDLIEKGKSIYIFRQNTRPLPEQTHTHDFIEIVYILSGSGAHTIDGVPYNVKHGDALFINYGSTHSFASFDNMSFINICFSPETLGESVVTMENAFSLLSLTSFNELCAESDGVKISFIGDERRDVENILFSMLSEYEEKNISYGRVMESYLNILITKMLRKSSVAIENDNISSVWSELSEYIDANLEKDLTLSSLAKKCFYNPSYFSRIFKEKFGMSLVEYISKKKTEKAIYLLINTELSVEEISKEAGFSDRSSFYRAFAKHVATTPTEYRETFGKVKKHDKNVKK